MFGMGTGGSSLLSSPDEVFACKYATYTPDSVGRYFVLLAKHVCPQRLRHRRKSKCMPTVGRITFAFAENILIIPSQLNNATHSDFMWSFLSLFLRFLEPAD